MKRRMMRVSTVEYGSHVMIKMVRGTEKGREAEGEYDRCYGQVQRMMSGIGIVTLACE